MKTLTFNIYTIDEHPEPEKCFEYIRNNWYDLGQSCIDDMVQSLEALASAVNGKLDYAISIVPDRGEFVRITNYDTGLLTELVDKMENLPLTGVCYDFTVIEGLACNELNDQVLKCIHDEGNYLYSDEGLRELCEANEYEFYENGKIA